MKLSAPEKLQALHILDDFDCGIPILNTWLHRYAMQNQKAGSANTFVVHTENRVVGFYSLTVGSVEHGTAPPRVKKGLARYPVPVMILARLAVDQHVQGKGIGKGLLKDAITRTLIVSEHAGIRAVFVHAKDENARMFYQQFDFESSPVDPFKMMLLMKDAIRTVKHL